MYFLIAQPVRRGVKVIIENNGALLLVRPNYSHRKWTLPGGGLKRGESFVEAGRREILEELGIHLDTLGFIALYESKGKRNIIQGLSTSVRDRKFMADPIEIAEAAWFNFDQLPPERVERMNSLIAKYIGRELNRAMI